MKRLTGWVMCCCLISVSGAWGADLPSLERGRQLFASEKLGTSGKSCATCHPGGKELKVAKTSGDEELAETINACIAGPLKGKRLDPKSVDMKSMVLYLKSVAGTGK
jgi:hypothetical protein